MAARAMELTRRCEWFGRSRASVRRGSVDEPSPSASTGSDGLTQRRVARTETRIGTGLEGIAT